MAQPFSDIPNRLKSIRLAAVELGQRQLRDAEPLSFPSLARLLRGHGGIFARAEESARLLLANPQDVGVCTGTSELRRRWISRRVWQGRESGARGASWREA